MTFVGVQTLLRRCQYTNAIDCLETLVTNDLLYSLLLSRVGTQNYSIHSLCCNNSRLLTHIMRYSVVIILKV